MKFYMTGQWQSLNTVDCLIEVIQKGMFDSIFILHVDLSTVRFLLRTPPIIFVFKIYMYNIKTRNNFCPWCSFTLL